MYDIPPNLSVHSPVKRVSMSACGNVKRAVLSLLFVGYLYTPLAASYAPRLIFLQSEESLHRDRGDDEVRYVIDVKSKFGQSILKRILLADAFVSIDLLDEPFLWIGTRLMRASGSSWKFPSKQGSMEDVLSIAKGVAGEYGFNSSAALKQMLDAVERGRKSGSIDASRDIFIVLSPQSLKRLNMGVCRRFGDRTWKASVDLMCQPQRMFMILASTVMLGTGVKYYWNRSDTNSTSSICSSPLEQLTYADVFWPRQKLLTKTEWIDYCTQRLALDHEELFVREAEPENDRVACMGCMEEKDGRDGISLHCRLCNEGEPLFYCHSCLYTHIQDHDISCKNNLNCNQLLPYQVVQDACEGGIFQVSLENLNEQQREALWADSPEVQKGLRARDAVATRYLNQLVGQIAARSRAFTIVTCTHEGCVFQALVERDTELAAVPCYFHPNERICVQCNTNYPVDARHQCRRREDVAFVNLAERRAANSFPCPNCSVEVQRSAACMHMTCGECGHHWCWYCVWHFFGEEGENNADKRQAYETQAQYTREHLSRFHGQLSFFHRNADHLSDMDDNTHPYIQYCHLGQDCICRSTDNNPFNAAGR
jgi:hypothetical protein